VYCFASYWQYKQGSPDIYGDDVQEDYWKSQIEDNTGATGTHHVSPQCTANPCPWNNLPKPNYTVVHLQGFNETPAYTTFATPTAVPELYTYTGLYTENQEVPFNLTTSCAANKTLLPNASCSYHLQGYTCAATSCFASYWESNLNNTEYQRSHHQAVTAKTTFYAPLLGKYVNGSLECVPNSCNFSEIIYTGGWHTDGSRVTWPLQMEYDTTTSSYECRVNGVRIPSTETCVDYPPDSTHKPLPPPGRHGNGMQYVNWTNFARDATGAQTIQVGTKLQITHPVPTPRDPAHCLRPTGSDLKGCLKGPKSKPGRGFCTPCQLPDQNETASCKFGPRALVADTTGVDANQTIGQTFDTNPGWVSSGYDCAFDAVGWTCGFDSVARCPPPVGPGKGQTAKGVAPKGTSIHVWNCENPDCFAERWNHTEITCAPNSCNYDEIRPPRHSRVTNPVEDGCAPGGAVVSGGDCNWEYTGNTGQLGSSGFLCDIAHCWAGQWDHTRYTCYAQPCAFTADIQIPEGASPFGPNCEVGNFVPDGSACEFFRPGGYTYAPIVCLAGVWGGTGGVTEITQSIIFDGLGEWNDAVAATYAVAYGIALQIYTPATDTWADGCSVELASATSTSRREGITKTFVAKATPSHSEIAREAATNLTSNAGMLITALGQAGVDASGLSLNALTPAARVDSSVGVQSISSPDGSGGSESSKQDTATYTMAGYGGIFVVAVLCGIAIALLVLDKRSNTDHTVDLADLGVGVDGMEMTLEPSKLQDENDLDLAIPGADRINDHGQDMDDEEMDETKNEIAGDDVIDDDFGNI